MRHAAAWALCLAGAAIAVLGVAAGGFLHMMFNAFADGYGDPLSWSSHLVYSLFWLIPLGAGAGLAAIGALGFRPSPEPA